MARASFSFSAPITVPLDCLERSDGNVRRIRPAIPIQSLADSISRKARGRDGLAAGAFARLPAEATGR